MTLENFASKNGKRPLFKKSPYLKKNAPYLKISDPRISRARQAWGGGRELSRYHTPASCPDLFSKLDEAFSDAERPPLRRRELFCAENAIRVQLREFLQLGAHRHRRRWAQHRMGGKGTTWNTYVFCLITWNV